MNANLQVLILHPLEPYSNRRIHMPFDCNLTIRNSYQKAQEAGYGKNDHDDFYTLILSAVASELKARKLIRFLSYDKVTIENLLNNIEHKLSAIAVLTQLSSDMKKIRPGFGVFDMGDDKGPVYNTLFIALEALITRKVEFAKQKTLEDQDNAIFNELQEGNPVDISALLKEACGSGQVVTVKYLLSNLTTLINFIPLIQAITNVCLKKAVDEDNNYLIFNEYNYLVEKYLIILKDLILKRPRIEEEHLNAIFLKCYEAYRKDGTGSTQKNQIITSCLENLPGIENLKKYMREEAFVYLAHHQGVTGDIVIKDGFAKSLEGLVTDTFLILQIRYYFELLIHIKIDLEEKPTAQKNNRFEFVKKEILMLFETLMIYHQIIIIIYSTNQVTVNQKLLEKIRSELIQTLALKIIQHIGQLKEGEEFLCPVSYQVPAHCFYVAFTRKEAHIIMRIDDLGDGMIQNRKSNSLIKNQSIQVGKKDKFYSCLVSCLPLDDFANNPKVMDYIQSLLLANALIAEEALPFIYSAQLSDRMPPIEVRETWPAKNAFKNGHCVLRNYNMGLQIRLNAVKQDKESYRELKIELEKIAVSAKKNKSKDNESQSNASEQASHAKSYFFAGHPAVSNKKSNHQNVKTVLKPLNSR